MIVKLSCLGALACLLAYLVMDPNQLEFTQTCGSDLSHSHQVSQLPHHIIPETTNFSRPCDSQHGAMAFFEVPLRTNMLLSFLVITQLFGFKQRMKTIGSSPRILVFLYYLINSCISFE